MRSEPVVKRAFGLLIVVAALGLSLWTYWSWRDALPAEPRAWFQDAHRPLILAHQGGENEWPSNTMYAFRRAHEIGADVLDTDLHMTRDGVLVLIHDTTVDRTTNGTGAISEMDWADLAGLDAAYRFSLDGQTYPLRGQGISIPRLDETLDAFPQWRLQIEVKQAPLEIAEALSKLLQAKSAEDRVLLSSFDEEMTVHLRKACPQVASSATPAEIRNLVIASWFGLEGLISPQYSALQVPLERHGITLVSPRIVRAAHARGVRVLPWTLDTDEDVEVCRKAGADGFNTNLPTRMLRYRDNWP